MPPHNDSDLPTAQEFFCYVYPLANDATKLSKKVDGDPGWLAKHTWGLWSVVCPMCNPSICAYVCHKNAHRTCRRRWARRPYPRPPCRVHSHMRICTCTHAHMHTCTHAHAHMRTGFLLLLGGFAYFDSAGRIISVNAITAEPSSTGMQR